MSASGARSGSGIGSPGKGRRSARRGEILRPRARTGVPCTSCRRHTSRSRRPRHGSAQGNQMDDNAARIVVVDDHPDVTETLAQLLEIDGYNVVTANDADSAMTVIERHRPHCVLLDVHMPGGSDGCDLSRRLRDTYGDDIVLVA